MQAPEPASRERLSLIALLAMVAVGIALCAVIVAPFVPGLVWALAFAIVAEPLHRWLSERVPRRNVAAALSVLIATLVLLIPTLFAVWSMGEQLADGVQHVQQRLESGEWRQALEGRRRLAALYDWINAQVNLASEAGAVATALQNQAGTWLRTIGWGAVQIVLALFTVFFLFRDRNAILRTVRSFMPLSDRETTEVFDQIRAMTYATVYGTVVVALIQGALGGAMFAILGIPGPFLWGMVMAVLAIVPTLGAFVVWLPAAGLLAAQGSWGQAIALAIWGTLIVGLIDNLLYPVLVGKEMRLHTLPVFLAIVGGIIVFGAAGVVLGPVILATTLAMLNILKRRTARSGSAARPT